MQKKERERVGIVDLFLLEYPNYFKIDSIDIRLLVVNTNVEKKIVLDEYPNANVIIAEDVIKWNKTYVTVSEIQEYYSTQLKVYRHCIRYITKKLYDAKIESMYYSSLAFWLYQFRNNLDIFLFFGSAIHGRFSDIIPIDIAIKMRKPALHSDIVLLGKKDISFYALKNILLNTYLDISQICPNDNKVNLSQDFYSTQINKKDTVKIPLKKYFGLKLLKSKFSIISYLVAIIAHYTSYKDQGIPYYITYFEYLKFKWYLFSLKQYYNKKAVSNIEETKPGILYALHFEPEAMILNRTIYNSQLYNIKMLSENLPKGWVLYVKEHPNQFTVSLRDSYYMKTFPFYRNKDYYNDICSLQNVKLISMKYKSKDLLSNSYPQIKAIATINGTIAAEAMNTKKTAILFDSFNRQYSEVSELFIIDSVDSLKSAIDKITHGFVPSYDNFCNKIEKYLLTVQNDKLNLSPESLSKVIDLLVSQKLDDSKN